jgi:excisionase family DNA binding protein
VVHNVSSESPILVSKKAAATLLSVSLRTIENLIGAKELSVRRIGRRVLIPHASLVQFAKADHPALRPNNIFHNMEERKRG